MSSGLVHSAQVLLAGILALARTRLELFSNELQEELTRLFFTLIGAMAVLLLAALGLAFAAFAAIAGLAEEYRALAAAGMGTVFLVGALLAAYSMRRLTREKPHVFAASLGELERDREAVQP